tara:strand:+ start:92563 stop:94200 length:1638 start_codon:yes stop_codon:yes gene_type:complete
MQQPTQESAVPSPAMLDFMRQVMSKPKSSSSPDQTTTQSQPNPLRANTAPQQISLPLTAAVPSPEITPSIPRPTGRMINNPTPRLQKLNETSMASNASADLSDLAYDQAAAIQDVLAGKNILLTGPAGTGKSYTINRIRDILDKNGVKYGITSTTGKSAILIGGKTIHSWSGIRICNTKDSALKVVMSSKAAQKRIMETNLLVIDEVSMLSANMMDILDYVFRIVRNRQEAFGGMQVVLSGDFYQLRPVKSEEYAFDSPRWGMYIQAVHELEHIFRQTDLEFCKGLNEVRVGEVTPPTIEMFAKCMNREFKGDIKPTELYPINEYVDALNSDELNALASEDNMIVQLYANDQLIERPKPRFARDEKFMIQAKSTMNKNCIAPELLELLIGAQVMLTKNLNVEAGLANGSRGVVVGFTNDNQPIVKFVNDIIMQIQTETWYMWVNETAKIIRTQFPLKLAWAMSIHKSQGATLDMARVDLGDRVFGEGMTYVALSRVRSLEGLSILSIDWSAVRVSKRVKAFYERCREEKKKRNESLGPNPLRNIR